MDNKEIRNTLHSLRLMVKYGIGGMVALFCTHCGLLALGQDSFCVHVLAVCFALLLGMKLSRLFQLCWAHRLAVLYVCASLLCIVLQRFGRFDACGVNVNAARQVMCVAGLVVIMCLLCRREGKTC